MNSTEAPQSEGASRDDDQSGFDASHAIEARGEIVDFGPLVDRALELPNVQSYLVSEPPIVKQQIRADVMASLPERAGTSADESYLNALRSLRSSEAIVANLTRPTLVTVGLSLAFVAATVVFVLSVVLDVVTRPVDISRLVSERWQLLGWPPMVASLFALAAVELVTRGRRIRLTADLGVNELLTEVDDLGRLREADLFDDVVARAVLAEMDRRSLDDGSCVVEQVQAFGLGEQALSAEDLVKTSSRDEVLALMDIMPGGSIGVAGSRGAGKSSLLRFFCESSEGDGEDDPVRVLVTAPVGYDARDFCLHLAEQFCKEVLGHAGSAAEEPARRRLDEERRKRRALVLLTVTSIYLVFALGILFLVDGLTGSHVLSRVSREAVLGAGTTLVGMLALMAVLVLRRSRSDYRESDRGDFLQRVSRFRADIKYQQSFTTGYSGSLKFPVAEGSISRTLSASSVPMSLPEIISRLRDLLKEATVSGPSPSRRTGERRQVFVGIDEVDKIGSPSDAVRFLNEVKAVFGVPHCFFFVSVSEDALEGFERRGVQVREVFDSVFDQIVKAEPLDFVECRSLLHGRVAGLPSIFIAVCYDASGGLPRDLIRVARNMVRLLQASPLPRSLDDIVPLVAEDAFRSFLDGTLVAIRRMDDTDAARIRLSLIRLRAQSVGSRLDSVLAGGVGQSIGASPSTVLGREVRAVAQFWRTLVDFYTLQCREGRAGAFLPDDSAEPLVLRSSLALVRRELQIDVELAIERLSIVNAEVSDLIRRVRGT